MSFRKKPAPTPVRRGEDPIIEPTDDVTFEYALGECAHFRNPITRANTRALLLLCRGAELDGIDLRWICGTDITRIAGAGCGSMFEVLRTHEKSPSSNASHKAAT